MSFAGTSSTCPKDEDLNLLAVITALVTSSVVCLIALLFYIFYTCHCLFSSRIQTQNHQDIEQGLSSQRPVIIDITEDKVKEDPEASKFKKVSWTAFKQDIINDKSHQYDDDDDDDGVKKTSTCVICFEEFREGDECRVRSRCNHIFHQTCIGDWLDDHDTCPLCRGRVPPIDWPYITTAADRSPD